ncbi:MAG: hypothetical protein KatS3mg047_1052 [Bellilinea sp.]|nr:MAG: hypothetical protein KatS3mg047_1052 [Bellilinea sp.]
MSMILAVGFVIIFVLMIILVGGPIAACILSAMISRDEDWRDG